jgi:hypothetical protein
LEPFYTVLEAPQSEVTRPAEETTNLTSEVVVIHKQILLQVIAVPFAYRTAPSLQEEHPHIILYLEPVLTPELVNNPLRKALCLSGLSLLDHLSVPSSTARNITASRTSSLNIRMQVETSSLPRPLRAMI